MNDHSVIFCSARPHTGRSRRRVAAQFGLGRGVGGAGPAGRDQLVSRGGCGHPAGTDFCDAEVLRGCAGVAGPARAEVEPVGSAHWAGPARLAGRATAPVGERQGWMRRARSRGRARHRRAARRGAAARERARVADLPPGCPAATRCSTNSPRRVKSAGPARPVGRFGQLARAGPGRRRGSPAARTRHAIATPLHGPCSALWRQRSAVLPTAGGCGGRVRSMAARRHPPMTQWSRRSGISSGPGSSGAPLGPLRARLAGSGARGGPAHRTRRTASRGRYAQLRAGRPAMPQRSGPPSVGGRWALAPAREPDPTRRAHARAEAFLERHGVLTRGALGTERMSGGFAGIYRVLRAMEDSGRARRGYVVEGLGAAQFAVPGAIDGLRSSPAEGVDGAGPLSPRWTGQPYPVSDQAAWADAARARGCHGRWRRRSCPALRRGPAVARYVRRDQAPPRSEAGAGGVGRGRSGAHVERGRTVAAVVHHRARVAAAPGFWRVPSTRGLAHWRWSGPTAGSLGLIGPGPHRGRVPITLKGLRLRA